MKLAQKKRLFTEEAYKRARALNYTCQSCGEFIILTENWYYDCWHFSHLKSRNRCNNWEYINYFGLFSRELHEYEHTRAGNLESNICVKHFLTNYPPTRKNFYSGWLDKNPDYVREYLTE